MAAGDLTTLQEVKDWLGLTNTNSDGVLSTLITAYSQAIKTYLGRDLLSAQYTDLVDGTGTPRILLQNYPIQSVSSVSINGTAVPARVTPYDGGWYLGGDANLLYRDGCGWPRGLSNISVTYTAGYAAVPAEIAQACTEWVAFKFRERERIGQSSKGMAGETTIFITKDAPATVISILNRYQKMVTV